MFYLAPKLPTYIATKINSGNFDFLVDPKFQQVLEFFGINKLFPLFILIGLIFILYVVQTIILQIGHVLPGRLSYSNQDLLIHVATPEKLVEWWSKFPELENIWVLLEFLENKIGRLPADRLSNTNHWQEQTAKYYRILSTLKVYALWALLMPLFLFGIGESFTDAIGKMLTVIILLLLIAIFVFSKEVYSTEQIGFSKVHNIDEMILNDEKIISVNDLIVEQKQIIVSEWIKSRPKKWWEIRFIDKDEIRWFFKNMLGKDVFLEEKSRKPKTSGKKSLWQRLLRIERLQK